MRNFRRMLLLLSMVLFFEGVNAQFLEAPVRLTVNMLEYADRVHLNGYLVQTPLNVAVNHREQFQYSEIAQQTPFFGWVVKTVVPNTLQVAWHVQVATSQELLRSGMPDFWDSGKMPGSHSVNVDYAGKLLPPGSVYFWRVRVWDNHGNESDWSAIRSFKMAESLTQYATAVYPLQKHDSNPVSIAKIDGPTSFVDFGRAAFGRLRLRLYAAELNDTISIHLGEVLKNHRIDRAPGGSRRYTQMAVPLKRGWNTYLLAIPPDERNTRPAAVLMPDYTGEVYPFRYVEFEGYSHPITKQDIVREEVIYPTDDNDARFISSDTTLNQVWDLSQYSIKATSFAGIYVDGDRERIPYEADAYINQLSHYGVAREYSMARASHEYLMHKPTWPTEWILQSVLMAWEDYLYTGNKQSLETYYSDLVAKTLISLADDEGFISTRTGKVTPDVLQSIYFNGELRDIVDWPHTGILGLEKDEGGETDGFVFTDVNTVVNAFHYRALVIMSQIAGVLANGRESDYFREAANRLRGNFNARLFDEKRGVYVDGLDTQHASLHANMFALAFGLVSEGNTDRVLEFVRSSGMACSVYGSQFLLDGVFDAGDAQYGLQLLTSKGERSWYNMIRVGSTISLEAWDNKYKPNQDWNHAWGAAPANLIPRKLMGIEPIEPGFGRVRIKPQTANLEWASIQHPTIRGDVLVSFRNEEVYTLEVELPANVEGEVWLPLYRPDQTVFLNGEVVAFEVKNNFAVVSGIGSGMSRFAVHR